MSCFAKQVGKRKKEETDSDPADSTLDRTEAIQDANGEQPSGTGRGERWKKRRKGDVDKELENAKYLLQTDFQYEVDEDMSKKEVLELLKVMVMSKNSMGEEPSSNSQPTGAGLHITDKDQSENNQSSDEVSMVEAFTRQEEKTDVASMSTEHNSGRKGIELAEKIEKQAFDKNSGGFFRKLDSIVSTSKPKKLRGLQLNKQQQTKASDLLKKTAVKLSQEAPVSSSQSSISQRDMNTSDAETQDPASQELFAAESKESPAVDHPQLQLNRIYSKAALYRRSKEMKSTDCKYFAPPMQNPVSYTKVILQLFDIYFRKLNKEQSKFGAYMEWGDAVKPGRHMSRTLDAKGRGQDSYPWSSDTEDEFVQTSGKSSVEVRKKSESPVSGPDRHSRDRFCKRRKSNEASETSRIQPRKPIQSSTRKRQTIDSDDELLDPDISPCDSPAGPGQATISDHGPARSTFVPQTLAVDDDMYMADTEPFDGNRIGSDESSDPESKPKVDSSRSEPSTQGQNELPAKNNGITGNSEGFFMESDSSRIQPRRSTRRSSPLIPSSKTSSYSNMDSPGPSVSQLSDDSGESSSIINSQGDIKPFQKSLIKTIGTFNLDIEEDDSKDSCFRSLVGKDNKVEDIESDSKNTKLVKKQDEDDPALTAGKAEDISSDSDKTPETQTHDSPVVLVQRKTGKTYARKRCPRASIQETLSGDDIFSEKAKKNAEKEENEIVNLSSDSGDDMKPSTSKKVRILTIIQTDTYERRTVTNSVKPIPRDVHSTAPARESSTSNTQAVDDLETVEKVACPMCSKMFDINSIDEHAFDCLGLQEVTSTTGDDSTNNTGPSSSTASPTTTRMNRTHLGIKGEHSDKEDHTERGEGDGKQIQSKAKPVIESTSNKEECCVCNEWIDVALIERHTVQCISTKMQEAEESRLLDLDVEEVQERRSTRSRKQGQKVKSAAQSSIPADLLENAESLSSEASDDRDPDWHELSTTESSSPVKSFQKISEMTDSVVDFKHQFKTSRGRRGRKS